MLKRTSSSSLVKPIFGTRSFPQYLIAHDGFGIGTVSTQTRFEFASGKLRAPSPLAHHAGPDLAGLALAVEQERFVGAVGWMLITCSFRELS